MGAKKRVDHGDCYVCVFVCVWKVFLTRRVAGNMPIAPRVSENEIVDSYLLIPIGGTCICGI